MEEQKQPNKEPRSAFSTPDLELVERERVFAWKVENLALNILRQHGLHSGPRKVRLFGPLSLIEIMIKLIEAFKVTLGCELADRPAPPLPAGLVPVLNELVLEDQLAAVLASLCAAAKRLHDEDDTPLFHVMRFFASLRKEPSPVQRWPGLMELIASLPALDPTPGEWLLD